jgi:peptidyl-prolyl cis-trans isomerase SurA
VEELAKSHDKIRELRNRILNGEKFQTLAILYSEDPGSASKGGELGMFNRGTMFPEFEAAAFNLNQVGEVSEIVKTEVGYHIIQLIEKQGDYINCRHILIQPKVSPLDLEKAKQSLDSVANLIESGEITFDEAALRYSDDPGRINGGLLMNTTTNTTVFEADELDPSLFFVIDKMEVGEISQPVRFLTEDKKEEAYRLLYLKMRTEPHRANLKDDYNKIQAWALENKRQKVIDDWINEKLVKTYIKISDRYSSCGFVGDWLESKTKYSMK